MSKYTKEELEQMLMLREQGATWKELSEIYGRTPHGIEQRLYTYKKERELRGGAEPAKVEEQPKRLVKMPTLADFSPRDMIKHLYSLGYRIENNQLVVVQRKVVNIQDVLK